MSPTNNAYTRWERDGNYAFFCYIILPKYQVRSTREDGYWLSSLLLKQLPTSNKVLLYCLMAGHCQTRRTLAFIGYDPWQTFPRLTYFNANDYEIGVLAG